MSAFTGFQLRAQSSRAYSVSFNVQNVAGQFSIAGILNPAANNVLVMVYRAPVSCEPAATISLRRHVEAGFPFAGGVNPLPHVMGQPSATCLLRTGTLAAIPSTQDLWTTSLLQANVPFELINEEGPIIIPPGQGLLITGNTVNTDIMGIISLTEDPLP